MGSSNLTDALTGLSIGSGDSVVVLIIDQKRGGYPKAEETRALTGSYFNSLCQIVSLPIHATYDDYKRVVPDEGQMSVDLACRMFGVAAWNDLNDGAFDFQRGGRIVESSFMSKTTGVPMDVTPRVYGQAVLLQSSWEHLMAIHGVVEDRESDVDMVMEAYLDICRRTASPDAMRADPTMRLYSDTATLLGMSAQFHTFADGRRVKMPSVASSFYVSENPLFGRDFQSWVDDFLLDVNHGQEYPEGAPWMREFVSALWDCRAFYSGMSGLNRVLAPSPSSGQQRLDAHQFDVALLALEQAGDSIIMAVSENGEDTKDSMRLDGMLKRMDVLRASLAERLAEMRSEADFPGL